VIVVASIINTIYWYYRNAFAMRKSLDMFSLSMPSISSIPLLRRKPRLRPQLLSHEEQHKDAHAAPNRKTTQQ
jgi:hypothetical protein